jgi:hypothetical protein
MIAVFDTNIVIDSLNGVVEADAEYARYDRVRRRHGITRLLGNAF